MSYYKRLLNLGQDGAPLHREANEDYTRMLEARYSLFRPTSDHRVRRHR